MSDAFAADLGQPDGGVVLRVVGVSKAFDATRALDEASLEVAPGEIHALVGGNGSGKSTLLKILAGVHQADAGFASIRGETLDLRESSPDAARRSGLHFVHQQPTTFDDLSVAENLAIGHGFDTGALGRIRWRAMRRRASDVLQRFGMDVSPHDRVDRLSPVMRTTLEIARALQDQEGRTDGVLALDEPTAALPPREVDRLLQTLRRYANAGQSILFVSHRLEEVLSIADRITVLRDGRTVATESAAEMTKERLAELIVGYPVGTYYPTPSVGRGERALLEVQGLTGGRVNDVSFGVERGEVLGIAGLVGSGRSTLLRLLFGAQTRDSGDIRIDGERVDPQNPADAIAAGIVYVSEDRARDSILPGLSLSENISLVSLREYWRTGYLDRRRERAACNEAITRFSIRAPSAGAPITTLSGGNQQKVAMARWLRRQPRLLLLDEPTQGVDVGARSELWALVQDAAASGTAVVMVSSDFEELTHLCNRLVVLRNGRAVAELPAAGLEPDEINHVLHEMQAVP